MAAGSERAQGQTGSWGPHPEFYLQSHGQAAFEVFFLAGESHVEMCSVPSSPATKHAFCGLDGRQSSTSESRLGDRPSPAVPERKKRMTAWTRGRKWPWGGVGGPQRQ